PRCSQRHGAGRELGQKVRARLTLIEADMRSWSDSKRFDLVFSSCGSMTHLLTLQDQLAAWRQSHENLNRGGRFVVDVPMPAMAAYADSFQVPPRAVLEVDRDVMAEESADRLIRYRSTRYLPHKQRAHIRFFP